MKTVALLVIALTAIGCKKKTKDTPAMASGSAPAGSAIGSAGAGSAGAGSDTTMAGSGSAMAGSGSAMAGSAAASDKTNFARFDDALAGTTPWITADEAKAGIVEMHAEDDLSGKTKGKFVTERRCGDAAKQAAETLGAALAKRVKEGKHDPAACNEEGDRKSCYVLGVGEGDVSYTVEYKKAGESWQLVGVTTTAVGLDTQKQDDTFKKLLDTKCK